MAAANRVAIVTASDSGIGKTTALMLAERGFDIGVTWHSDEDGALKTCYSFWLPSGSRNRPAAMCGRRCEQDLWCATPGRAPLLHS